MVEGRMDVPGHTGSATTRLERLRAGGAWGSRLSVREFAALTGAGFDPVGHVLGSAVINLRSVKSSGICGGPRSHGTHVAPRGEMRELALSRAVAECQALGGDGIVGARVRVEPFPAGGSEFTVQGTAVRARGSIRPSAPFTCHVSAQEFARLLQAGWVPAALVFGVSLGTRHAGPPARQTGGNREMRIYTELVSDTRSDARARLGHAARLNAADGVVTDQMTLYLTERECRIVEGHRDRIAVVTILGTAIVRFGRSRARPDHPPLTIMRLNRASSIPA